MVPAVFCVGIIYYFYTKRETSFRQIHVGSICVSAQILSLFVIIFWFMGGSLWQFCVWLSDATKVDPSQSDLAIWMYLAIGVIPSFKIGGEVDRRVKEGEVSWLLDSSMPLRIIYILLFPVVFFGLILMNAFLVSFIDENHLYFWPK